MFEWKHPNYYKKLRELQRSENDQESENNQDTETSEEQSDPQSQDKS